MRQDGRWNTAVLPTQAQPLLGLLESLRGRLHLTLEEGTYAAWLYDLLQGRVAELVVCDPRHNALLKEGSKTDHQDAHKLADLLRTGMLRPVYHGNRSLRNLRELAHAYEALVQDTTRVMNRIKAYYRSYGIDCAGRGVYSRKQRESWLGRLPAGASRVRGELLHDQLEQLRSLRRRARRELLAESRKYLVAARLRRGAGFRTSARGLADRRDADSSSLSHAGQVVVLLRPGAGSKGQQRVSAGGGTRGASARRPAIARAQPQPPARAESPLQIGGPGGHPSARTLSDYYQSRLQQGADPAILRVTVARKLAALVLSLWKKGGRYRAEGVKQA